MRCCTKYVSILSHLMISAVKAKVKSFAMVTFHHLLISY